MKMIADFSKDILMKSRKLEKKLIRAQKDTAEEIKKDVLDFAPSKTGEYANSIKVSETQINQDNIKTDIYTDLKSTDGHYIGRMIENGTGIYALEPHIGKTKTFIKSGYQYWYVPVEKAKRPIGRTIVIDGNEFYVVHAQPPKPHFRPALDKNIQTYRDNIRKAIKEAL